MRLPDRVSAVERSSVPVAAAALFSRASILAVLYVASTSLSVSDRNSFIFAAGVVTAVQVLVDPVALANFYLASHHHFDALRSHGLFVVARLQLLLGLLVIVLPPLFVLAAGESSGWIGLTGALGVLAFGENTMRFKRVASQDREDFIRFAGVDVLIGAVRCATAVVLLAWSIEAFAAACVLAGVVEAATAAPRRPGDFHAADRISLRNLVSEAWPYSATTLFTATYSQGPVVLLGILGSVSSAATYAIAARLTQPLELLPSAIASVHMPRLVRHSTVEFPAALRRQSLFALAAAIPVVILVDLIGPLALDAFGFDNNTAYATLFVLSAVLLFKFVSYQLVAGAISRGRIRARFKISAFIAGVSVVSVAAVASIGPVAAALVTLGCEIMLCAALLILHARETTREAGRA
ncbi:MAG: hypothetical protein JHD02_01950 [Thermoleophilaceae bacterium]|nr:hypothetical protein [Thermoleophilaceae bacterium]